MFMRTTLSALVLADSGMNESGLETKTATDWTITILDAGTERDAIAAAIADVDAIVGGPLPIRIPDNARLRLYQAPFAGYDWIAPADLPGSAVFCNTYEHETTIAEHVLTGMLEFQTELLRVTHPLMRSRSYAGRSINLGPKHRELRGTTIGIVGYGRIGREVARRCKAFDMRVMAVSRHPRDDPERVDWYGTPDQLRTLLETSDFILVCAPGGKATQGMIGAAAFRAMKQDAVVINVGRGEVVDEAALYEALVAKRIRGAVIDVWYVYPSPTEANPWPSRFPFQKLDNIIMSPHNSAWTTAMSDRRWTFVGQNLDRFARGEPLHNVCFTGKRSVKATG